MTYNELYRQTKSKFEQAGADAPAFDALCLLEEVFSVDRHALIIRGNDEADKDGEALFFKLAKRRADGEPLQYILGKWQFMNREFFVGEGVLIPREDTACAVNAAIQALRGRSGLEIADLCAGSGAIAVTLGKELDCRVAAVELYDDAFAYLERNIEYNGAYNVKAYKADVLSGGSLFDDNSLDLVISNPPYIKSGEIPTLQKEVRREPESALDGGEDGLLFYRAITDEYTKKLKYGGMLCYEIGEGQYEQVEEIMRQHGYENIDYRLDYQNIKRCIFGYNKRLSDKPF